MIDQAVIEKEQIPSSIPGGSQELIEIARDLYVRYQKPVFITETSYNGSEEQRIEWLNDVIQASHEMIDEGIELYGVTWFPFLDMADWPYRTNGLSFNANIATFGLYTLEELPDGTIRRTKNAVGKRFEETVKMKSTDEMK